MCIFLIDLPLMFLAKGEVQLAAPELVLPTTLTLLKRCQLEEVVLIQLAATGLTGLPITQLAALALAPPTTQIMATTQCAETALMAPPATQLAVPALALPVTLTLVEETIHHHYLLFS
jgi:hypothetical protein